MKARVDKNKKNINNIKGSPRISKNNNAIPKQVSGTSTVTPPSIQHSPIKPSKMVVVSSSPKQNHHDNDAKNLLKGKR